MSLSHGSASLLLDDTEVLHRCEIHPSLKHLETSLTLVRNGHGPSPSCVLLSGFPFSFPSRYLTRLTTLGR